MILVNKENITESTFTSLLEVTKSEIIKQYSKNVPKVINGNVFETAVYNQMLISANNTHFHGHIEQTGTYSFPDIVARKLYGVEVKMTKEDKWISTGNSVLESTRIPSVETIYMFFGKFGKAFDVKYRKYQECLYDVGVTHSPRYKIDMDLQDGHSIFDKLNVDYNVFRKEPNSIKRLKGYYKKQLKAGEELWWIGDTTDSISVSPIIRSLSKFEKGDKEKFITECLILFPEIFSNSTIKFERAAAYLITNYNAVSSNLRDSFTSGGRMTISIKGVHQTISKLLYNFFLRAKNIKELIQDIPKDKLEYYWGVKINDEPLKMWKYLIKESSKEDIDIISVFNEGLKNG